MSEQLVFLTVKHHFSAGHRVPGLPGPGAKCSNIHGHTFGVEWTFQVSGLDASEFEFAAAKKLLRTWVDETLDHGFLAAPDDTEVTGFLLAAGHKLYIIEPAPTTEAIAAKLLAVARVLIEGARCTQVLVTEGPHNEARVVAPR